MNPDDKWICRALEFYEEQWDSLKGNQTIDALAIALQTAYEEGRAESQRIYAEMK